MSDSLLLGVGTSVATQPASGWLRTARPGSYGPSALPTGKPPPDLRVGRPFRPTARQTYAAADPEGGRPAPPRLPLAPPARGGNPFAAAAASGTTRGPPPVSRDAMAEARHLLRTCFGHRVFAPGK